MLSKEAIAFSILYFSIFITSLIGNSFILAAVYTHKKLHSTVNILLANVALADFFFTFFSIANCIEFLAEEWLLSDAVCRIQGTLIEVFYTVSIITLSVISLERYFIICRTKRPRRSKITSIKIAGVIWAISFAFCSPLFYGWMAAPNAHGKIECYNNRWSNDARFIYYSLHAFFVYILPLCVMLFAHYNLSSTLRLATLSSGDQLIHPDEGGRNKFKNECKEKLFVRKKRQRMRNKKIINLLVTITVLFVVLWTPFIAVRLVDHAGIRMNSLTWMLTQLLAFLNTAVNFFIYAVINQELRSAFQSLSCCGLFERLENTSVISTVTSSTIQWL